MSIMAVREWRQPLPTKIHEEAGWRYRYIRKDQVERRLQEGNGWEIVNKQIMKDHPEAASMEAGSTHYRGHVLMRIPEEVAKQRDQFYRDRHARRIRASAVAASMAEAGKKINADKGNITGVIGKTMIQDVVTGEDGMVVSKRTQNFDSQDVTQADVEEMIEVKKEQAKEEQPLSEAKLQDEQESIPVKKRGRPKGHHTRR